MYRISRPMTLFLVGSLSACLLCLCTASPHLRRQIDITIDPSQQELDPDVVAKGLHRPLAVLCPSVDISDVLHSEPTNHNNDGDHSSVSKRDECEPKCDFDSDCAEGSLCCSSKCGSRSCVPPVVNPSSVGQGLIDRADKVNLICGRFICSQRLKEACVTVVLKSCKPTSIDFECPTTQQCLPRGSEDCSTKSCPAGTKCVMVECTDRGYCNPLPKCLGSSTATDSPASPSSLVTTSTVTTPRTRATSNRPFGGGFPNFPVFPSRSTTTGSTSTVTSPSPPSSSLTTDLTSAASSSSSSVSVPSDEQPSSGSSSSTVDTITPLTSSSTASSTPSSTTPEMATASAAALDSDSESGSSSSTNSPTPLTTTLEYIVASSSPASTTSVASSSAAAADETSEATSEASSPSTAPPVSTTTLLADVPSITSTLSTSASTLSQGPSSAINAITTGLPGEEEEGMACTTPCGPGFNCKRVSIEGCTFVDGTLVCNFEMHCIPHALPSCEPDPCAPWETCVVEGKGCRNVTAPSASSEILVSRRCGPECYAPILGETPAVGQFNCGRAAVKCKRDEACVPVVQTTCKFNAAADLECDYIDACVSRDVAQACQSPDTGCHDDEHCVMQVADECLIPANPNENCPPQVQCYGLSLNLTTGACADFECEKGDVCADMAKNCDYDSNGDLECEFEDVCVPDSVAKDCDNDLGCANDETCILEQVACVTQPCYPLPRCIKKRDPALVQSTTNAQQGVTDVMPAALATTAAQDADQQCGTDVCRINEFCAKTTNAGCTFKDSTECVFKKACLPARKPSCRQAVCPADTTCVNIETTACVDFFCDVEPRCIPLTDPAVTTTLATSTTDEEETTSPASSSSSGSADDAAVASTSAGAAEATTDPSTPQAKPVQPVLSAGKACGKGKRSQICNSETEICGEVAVTCFVSSSTSPKAKLSCKYEERCLRQSAPSCLTQRCADGRHCIMREVRCVSAPCDPVPECVRRADYDVNPRFARLFSERFINY